MKKLFYIVMIAGLLTACAHTEPSSVSALADSLFTDSAFVDSTFVDSVADTLNCVTDSL